MEEEGFSLVLGVKIEKDWDKAKMVSVIIIGILHYQPQKQLIIIILRLQRLLSFLVPSEPCGGHIFNKIGFVLLLQSWLSFP
jgi:hypothetical protein